MTLRQDGPDLVAEVRGNLAEILGSDELCGRYGAGRGFHPYRTGLPPSGGFEVPGPPRLGIRFRSFCEPWLDNTSAFGEALYCITAAQARLGRGILSEHVKAAIARARKQGTALGRAAALNGNLEASSLPPRDYGRGMRALEYLHTPGVDLGRLDVRLRPPSEFQIEIESH